MADLKISALPSATTPLAGTEVLPIVQSSTTDQVTVANLTAGRAVSASSLTLTSTPLASGSGGTGLSSFTSNGVVYASSTSALTTGSALIFDGTNLGIGVTPSAWNTSTPVTALQLPNGSLMTYSNAYGFSNLYLSSNAYLNSSSNWIYTKTNSASQYSQTNGAHTWYNAPSGTAGNAITFTQAMTLDASGNLLVTKTSSGDTSVGLNFYATGAMTSTGSNINTYNYYNTAATAYRFYVDSGGTIHATSTTITAISDATLKTNIKPLETGLAEILKLQPRRFDWVESGLGTNVAGFISQEVQTVLPDLVSDFRYSKNTDGTDITKLGLKMGDMIPTMVNAIQQLSAQITALQAQITALTPKA